MPPSTHSSHTPHYGGRQAGTAGQQRGQQGAEGHQVACQLWRLIPNGACGGGLLASCAALLCVLFGVVSAESHGRLAGTAERLVRFACVAWQDSAGRWGYKDGKSHLESLPLHFKYNDVAFRWTEKVKGDLTGLKYQLPGEELEPDALISVSDDNDLHVSSKRIHVPQRLCPDKDDYVYPFVLLTPWS